LATSSESGVTAIVDPAPSCAELIITYVSEKGFKVEKILITHSHWDHIADTAELKNHYNAPVYIHRDDAENLEVPGSDGIPLWEAMEVVQPDYFLKDGDIVDVGTLKFVVIHTPGHSPGSICFYCKEENILFAGDTLFKKSIGNLALPTSNAEMMWNSLNKLASLPPETKVYPGHGESTTIGDESWLPNARQIFGGY